MFRARVQGAPPPRGWFIKYVSGMEEKPDIKPGFWLSHWHVDSHGYVTFNFEHVPDLHWGTKTEADAISMALRESTEIKTAVVQL